MAGMNYPHGSFRYKLDIDGISSGRFSEVSGLDVSFEVKEYREGDMLRTAIKMPGLKKYSNITLKKGIDDSIALYEWFMRFEEGKMERKTVTISLLDLTESAVVSWQLINAWPTKYIAPSFDATSSEVSIEQLELSHEGVKKVI